MRFMRTGLLAGVVGLSACGGGGGDGAVGTPSPNPGPTAPASANNMLLPFVTAAGELKAIDPATPGAGPLAIDAGLTPQIFLSYVSLLDGTYDGATNALADGHVPLMLYVKQGQVFRVALARGVSHSPVRVSSLTDACRFEFGGFDFANKDNSRIVVSTAGTDASCAATADNGARFLSIMAGTGTAGQEISLNDFRLRDTLYAADGGMLGFLVQEGPSTSRLLRRYDVNLANGLTLATLEPGTGVDLGGPEPDRNTFYLRMRQAGSAACLHRYAASTNQVSPCLHAFAGSAPLAPTSEADGSHTYFADGGGAYRVPHTGSAASPLANLGASFVIGELLLSSGRVVLNGVDNSTGLFSLVTIPRTGGTLSAVRTGAPAAIDLAAVAGSRIYYTADGDAHIAPETGSPQTTFADAGWGGFSVSTARFSLGLTNRFNDLLHGGLGVASPSPTVVVSSRDAQTGTALQTLGTVDFLTASFSTPIGRYRLGELAIFRPSTSSIDTDVYFADTLTANSLQLVAGLAGPGQNDRIVP